MRLFQTVKELKQAAEVVHAAAKTIEAQAEALKQSGVWGEPLRGRIGNRERIAGWSGPAGWRLETYESKKCECACCGETIRAGDQHAGWRIPAFPAPDPRNAAALEADQNRRWAHIGCLHRLGTTYFKLYEDPLRMGDPMKMSVDITGLRWPTGLAFVPGAVPAPLRKLPSWRNP